jgi:uncharacterized membrane protein
MPSPHHWTDRFGGAAGRLTVSVLAGVGVFALVPGDWSWVLRSLAGWSAGAAVYLAMAWSVVMCADAETTKRRSRTEDPSRALVDALLTVAALVSLAAVAVALSESGKKDLPLLISVGLPMLTVALGWTLVHTLYAMHYARLYYHNDQDSGGPPTGGLDLHENAPPDYRDFLYVAFSIACTFGVTDVNVTAKPIRRVITKHAVLSFALATIVLALAVNVFTNLLSSE